MIGSIRKWDLELNELQQTGHYHATEVPSLWNASLPTLNCHHEIRSIP